MRKNELTIVGGKDTGHHIKGRKKPVNVLHKKVVVVTGMIIGLLFLNLMTKDQFSYALKQPSSNHWLGGETSSQPGSLTFEENKKVLVLPTTSGLYLVQDGEVKNHYLAGKHITAYVMVADLDGDGKKDLAVSTADDILPNIYAIGSQSGQIIWTFSSGYKEIDHILAGKVETEDILIISAGKSLYGLSCQNGEKVWEYTDKHRISSAEVIMDINGDQHSDVAFTNELGAVAAIGGLHGEQIWRKDKGNFDAISVSARGILTTSSDGNLYLLDPIDGNPLWKVKMAEQRINHAELIFQGNINGDEVADAVLYFNGNIQRIAAVSGRDGALLWEHIIPPSLEPESIAVHTITDQSILITGIITNYHAHSFVMLNPANGAKLREGLFPMDSLTSTTGRASYLAAANTGGILLSGSQKEVIYLDHNYKKVWAIPRLKNSGYMKYDSAGKEFLLLYSADNHDDDKIGLIQKVNTAQDILWEFFLGSSPVEGYGGLEKLIISSDLNQDGMKDLVGALSAENENAAYLSAKIIALSGEDGQILWEADLILNHAINSVFEYHDINGDSIPEIFAGTTTHYYVLDGGNGKIIKNWPHYYLQEKNFFEPTKGIQHETAVLLNGDVNKDGFKDLFVVSAKEVRLGLTTKTEGLEFYFKDIYKIANGNILANQTKLLDDLDQDGIPELILKMLSAEGISGYTIIAGATGEKMALVTEEEAIFQAVKEDFNNDGIREVLLFTQNKELLELRILDGARGGVLWSYSGFNGSLEAFAKDMLPACLMEDLNNDGIRELAIAKNTTSDTGLVIEIFDVAGGWSQPYKSIIIQETADGKLKKHWTLGLIENILLNSRPYLAVVGRLGGEESQTNLMLYDLQKDKVVAIFPVAAYQVEPTDRDSLLVQDGEGRVDFWDIPKENAAITIKQKSSFGSPVQIQWEHKDSIVRTRIYVNNIAAWDTTKDSTLLELAEGEHTVGIAQFHLNGEHTFQSVKVKVVKNQNTKILTVALTLFSLGVVLVLPRLLKGNIRAGAENA